MENEGSPCVLNAKIEASIPLNLLPRRYEPRLPYQGNHLDVCQEVSW